MSLLCFWTSGSSVSALFPALCNAGLAPELVVLSVDLSEADCSEEEDDGVDEAPLVVDSGDPPDEDFPAPWSAGASGPGCSLSTCGFGASDLGWPDWLLP